MQCAYCDKPIEEGQSYTYKWFPEDQKTKPVHSEHLRTIKRKPTDG